MENSRTKSKTSVKVASFQKHASLKRVLGVPCSWKACSIKKCNADVSFKS